MIRVTEFTMDGITLRLASMSCAEAEVFVTKTQAMLKREDASAQEWFQQTLQTVADSLNKAALASDGGEQWDAEKLKTELDLQTVNAAYLRVLEFSGLRTAGESTAVSALPRSAAA